MSHDAMPASDSSIQAVITTARPWTPLASALLCGDCEAIYPLAMASCPACGSATAEPLRRFLDPWRIP